MRSLPSTAPGTARCAPATRSSACRFKDGKPTGGYEDFITGWSLGEAQPQVWGRPVAIVVHRDGSLLISDDAHNQIWRVTYKQP